MRSKNKYKNIELIYDNIVFASKAEVKFYKELKLRQIAGEIVSFERQVVFELIPTQRRDGKVVERAAKYKADFVVNYPDGRWEVIDVKSRFTKKLPDYVIRRKLMLFVHNIPIKEVIFYDF